MKKKYLTMLLALLLLTACTGGRETAEDNTIHILATTYPVYLFTTAVTEGVAGVEVSLLVNQPTSCLHDYTLTVRDMKAVEQADIIVMNGAGLEDFMSDALRGAGAEIIDCSAGLELLPAEGHEGHDGHDHEEQYDPHYWLSPYLAQKALDNILLGLITQDGDRAEVYVDNAAAAGSQMVNMGVTLKGFFDGTYDAGPVSRELITFHNGFRYLADYLHLDIVKAIEEEAGSEASAKEIVEVTALVREHGIPAIFTERNGSDATARAVARETGVDIYQLDMIMSGDGTGLQPYLDSLNANAGTILEALG